MTFAFRHQFRRRVKIHIFIAIQKFCFLKNIFACGKQDDVKCLSSHFGCTDWWKFTYISYTQSTDRLN